MRFYLLCLYLYIDYVTRTASDEIETAPVTVSYHCETAADPACCPEQCILNDHIDHVDISECLDAIEPHCEISMIAKSIFDQIPCFTEIESRNKSIKRYSTWYRFPSGLKVLKLPWVSGSITPHENPDLAHGCHVIEAGLADAPRQDCQPLPESSLFEVPWLNFTLGELDGLVSMTGHRQALNVISEAWWVGETNGLTTLKIPNLDTGKEELEYPHWEARCDPPGYHTIQIEVRGSAFGRKNLRTPAYSIP